MAIPSHPGNFCGKAAAPRRTDGGDDFVKIRIKAELQGMPQWSVAGGRGFGNIDFVVKGWVERISHKPSVHLTRAWHHCRNRGVPRAGSGLSFIMRYAAFTLALSIATVFAGEDEKVLVGQISGNHHLRLTGAQISMTRGQNLQATFTIVGSTNTIGVQFPSHSFSPLETTLMTVVTSCVDWATPTDPHRWHKTKSEAVFSAPTNSVPINSVGYVTDFSRWFLISLSTTNVVTK